MHRHLWWSHNPLCTWPSCCCNNRRSGLLHSSQCRNTNWAVAIKHRTRSYIGSSWRETSARNRKSNGTPHGGDRGRNGTAAAHASRRGNLGHVAQQQADRLNKQNQQLHWDAGCVQTPHEAVVSLPMSAAPDPASSTARLAAIITYYERGAYENAGWP